MPGAPNTPLWTARGLIERGYDVGLVVFNRSNPFPKETPRETRLVVLSPGRKRRYWERLRIVQRFCFPALARLVANESVVPRALAIAEYIDRERPDAVRPSLRNAKPATVIASRLASRSPVLVAIMRNAAEARTPARRRSYASLLPVADKVVAASQGVRHGLVRDLDIPAERVATIHKSRVPLWTGRARP